MHNHQPHGDVDLEEMFKRILASQQPFFTALVNQIASIETRLIKQGAEIADNSLLIDRLVRAEFAKEVGELDSRVKKLEEASQRRLGLVEAFNWLPKAIAYAVAFIGILFVYFNAKKILP